MYRSKLHASRTIPWVLLVAILGAAAGVGLTRSDHHDPHRGRENLERARLDSDGDGLSDRAEATGLRIRGSLVVTDGQAEDTDGDGLSDGDEAGALSTDSLYGVAYEGLSDPTKMDSDSDGLDDASEVDGGFDTWSQDSDGDGLGDLVEIEFGSDPLNVNADGDHLDDSEEMREGSDPNTYDLTGGEAGEAFFAGFANGEPGKYDLPLELQDAQLSSWQYLMGSIASDVLGVGDIRDVIADIGSGDWSKALAESSNFVPGLSETKVAAAAVRFASKSVGATQSALRLVSGTGALSPSAKARITRLIVKIDPVKARLPQDVAVKGRSAPAALSTKRPISLSLAQNLRKDEIVRDLEARGFSDIRVNQQQVDSAGAVVGINRPDIQATGADGIRHYWELDASSTDHGTVLTKRIASNDVDGVVCLLLPGTQYPDCAA
ncbi:MAG: hypothetical protein ABWX92_09105 [Mycetocola sp.]